MWCFFRNQNDHSLKNQSNCKLKKWIDCTKFYKRLFCFWSIKHTASFWNIIIQWTSHDDLTEKLVSLFSSAKLVKWQNVKLQFGIWQKNWLCLTSFDDQIFKSFWKPNPWMNLLEKKILLYQFLFYFLQFKFLPPWMACFNWNINDLDFDLSRLRLIEAIHSESNLICKK